MASSIPLLCNICPKRPKFSDVSHLLTHIASKGHLSHYYKVKVRSSTDAAARHLIETYDQWYGEWNVEDLMSERMNLKDKKRPRTRATATTRVSSASSHNNMITASRTRLAAGRQNGTNRATRLSPALSAFDPRLVDPNIKSEPKATPPLRTMDVTAMHGIHVNNHSSQGPHAAPSCDAIANPYHSVHRPAAGRRDSIFEHVESTKSPGAYTYPEPPRQSAYLDQVVIVSTSPLRPPCTPVPSQSPGRQEIDNSRLKGVLWPGMSIFDSATPTARRRRNQKKDASILEQLEASSLEVEPTEIVWTPGGNLKKERVITGNPSESSSPWRSTPPKPEDHRLPLKEVAIRKPYFGRGQLDSRTYDTYTDELTEDGLNYTGLSKRKRVLRVYRDHHSEPEDHERNDHRASLACPAPMSYLTRSLGKENEQTCAASLKHEQPKFATAFHGNLFEHQGNIEDDDDHYRASGHMADHHQENYTSNLFHLADAAATSTPFQTAVSMSNGYNSMNTNSYGLACPSQFLHERQLNTMQQQYQYNIQHQHPVVHAGSHIRSLSTTAGPMHDRFFSNGMQNFGMSLQQHFHGFSAYGHGHSYQSTDQPTIFSHNGSWTFGGGNNMYENSTRTSSGCAFDHPNPVQMPTSLESSSIQDPALESPVLRKVEEERMVPHEDEIDLPIQDALSDRFSCGQPEASEDEGRTITAPATPYS